MPNRLTGSSSPYLRQHQDNPVEWFPWGDEAFEEARRRDVPVMLSVGYSACHWCHVMAHESFEDPDVAEILNADYVSVKVDREERPDVDSIYMDAVQALTGRGGWPMTVFCTPAGEPFYGGTYYPRETFVRLLQAVTDAWVNRRDELRLNVTALVETIGRTAHLVPSVDYDADALRRLALDGLRRSFDPEWGGFGPPPKFPSTHALDLCLHELLETGDVELAAIVRTSLDAMAAGGIRDHLGGGFARYSVDRQWLVPHFEKMLYDQALLLRVYTHAASVTGEERYSVVARDIVEYVLRDMRSPEGAFYAAEDADSPDEDGRSSEGAFYTWTPGEIRSVLATNADEAMSWWGVTEEGNFEGRSILHRLRTRESTDEPPAIAEARASLLAARALRPRPGLDDKVLMEWNAMMLSALCEAATLWSVPAWVDAARANGTFLVERMRGPDGRWHRSWSPTTGDVHPTEALAHDVVHLVDAFTRLYELTAESTWLYEAVGAADLLLDEYWDAEHGGVFTVGTRGESLIVRQKDVMDNATPSANSAAAVALLRLAAHVGEPRFHSAAHAILRLLAAVIPQAPTAFCHAITAIHSAHRGLDEVVIPGGPSPLLDAFRRAWRPHAIVAWGDATTSPLWTARDAGFAYVCRDGVCSLPVSDHGELERRLVTTHRGG